MALVAKTVRFSPNMHRVIEHAATREGVSTAEYVRESVLARAFFDLGRIADANRLSMAEVIAKARSGLEELGFDGSHEIFETLVGEMERVIEDYQ